MELSAAAMAYSTRQRVGFAGILVMMIRGA
jgi:hypothetical protein